MNKFWKKYKEYFFVGLFPIIFLLLVFFAAKPLFEEIENNFDAIEKEKADKEEMRRKLGEFDEIQRQAEKIQEQEKILEITLKKEQIVQFVQELEDIAKNTGNEISIETKDKETLEKEMQKRKKDEKSKEEEGIMDSLPSENYLYFTIKSEGEYGNLINFINKIENLKYYSDIVSFDINKEIPLAFAKERVSRNAFAPGVSEENQETDDDKNDESIKEIEKNTIYSVLELVVYLKDEEN